MNNRQRMHYTIGQVSEMVEIKEHVLRFWEKEFPQLSPKKTPKGRRTYTDRDIQIIERIKYLLYTEKFTVSGARQSLNDEMGTIQQQSITPLIKQHIKKEIKNQSPSLAFQEKKKVISQLKEIINLLQ